MKKSYKVISEHGKGSKKGHVMVVEHWSVQVKDHRKPGGAKKTITQSRTFHTTKEKLSKLKSAS